MKTEFFSDFTLHCLVVTLVASLCLTIGPVHVIWRTTFFGTNILLHSLNQNRSHRSTSNPVSSLSLCWERSHMTKFLNIRLWTVMTVMNYSVIPEHSELFQCYKYFCKPTWQEARQLSVESSDLCCRLSQVLFQIFSFLGSEQMKYWCSYLLPRDHLGSMIIL